MKSFLEDFKHYFEEFGISQKQLRELYKKEESVADYGWQVFQKVLQEIASDYQRGRFDKKEFHHKQANTYKQMAYLLKLEDKDSRHIQSLEFENEVRYMELNYPDLIGVKILSYGCCDGCHPYNNRVLPIDEALTFAIETHLRCRPLYTLYSRCTLIPVTSDDDLDVVTMTLGS